MAHDNTLIQTLLMTLWNIMTRWKWCEILWHYETLTDIPLKHCDTVKTVWKILTLWHCNTKYLGHWHAGVAGRQGRTPGLPQLPPFTKSVNTALLWPRNILLSPMKLIFFFIYVEMSYNGGLPEIISSFAWSPLSFASTGKKIKGRGFILGLILLT